MSESGNGKSPVRRLGDVSELKDERIVYGATCTWWGTIHEVGLRPLGGGAGISKFGIADLKKTGLPRNIPCCPACGGMLFEMDSIRLWDENVAKHETTHPGYKKFIAWMRGKCYRRLPDARDAYVKETGAILTW